MAAATDQQVQNFSDQQIRTFCEAIFLSAYQKAVNARATFDDVYAALTAQNPTWTDSRTDGPPHLASKDDVLALNTFMSDFITFCETNDQWAIVKKLIVRLPN